MIRLPLIAIAHILHLNRSLFTAAFRNHECG
jgi:hypothetical protein